jgi:hypothetical protein
VCALFCKNTEQSLTAWLRALAYMNIEITTHSRPDAFPSVLRQRLRTTQTKVHHADEETRTKVRIHISSLR